MYDIVIARYNESLDWMERLTPEQKSHIKVYNKGPDDLSCPVTEKLPNVGREGHTYLWYIIQNYESLPDYVIFMQANPFDHFKFEPKDISDVLSEWLRVTKWYGITSGMKAREFGHDTTREFRIKEYKGMLYQSSFNFGEWMDEFVEKDVCPPKTIHGCGFFGVSRKLIKTRSVEYYKKILDDLAVHNNPESGHYLERSWHYIFNGHRHTPVIPKLKWLTVIFLFIFIGIQLSREFRDVM
jgi:hypothetical protein